MCLVTIHKQSFFIYKNRSECIVLCPYCKQQVRTKIIEKVGTCAIIVIVIICFIFWPLFWIPLLCNCCGIKNKDHYCTNTECQRRIGQYAPCNCYS